MRLELFTGNPMGDWYNPLGPDVHQCQMTSSLDKARSRVPVVPRDPASWIRKLLSGGDRRSIGRVSEVVAAVRREPALFGVLARAMDDPDPIVAFRACDAVEKLTVRDAAALQPWAELILDRLSQRPEAEIRWHVAQLLPRLSLSSKRRTAARRVLRGYRQDSSRIVQVLAMQAMWDMGRHDAALRREARAFAERTLRAGPPSLRARARKLLGRS